MRRLDDWPIRLDNFLTSRQGVPFKWGENDCLTFCADAVMALTGHDHMRIWRGSYSDEDGANRILSDLNMTFNEAICYALGNPLPRITFAKRGDVVSFYSNGRHCGGIVDCTGKRIAILSQERGLIRVPLLTLRTHFAWSY